MKQTKDRRTLQKCVVFVIYPGAAVVVGGDSADSDGDFALAGGWLVASGALGGVGTGGAGWGGVSALVAGFGVWLWLSAFSLLCAV